MSPTGKYMGGLYGSPGKRSIWQRIKAFVKRVFRKGK